MASSKTSDKAKIVTFSVRAPEYLYDYLIQRAQAAGLNRAEMIRLLLSLPIVMTSKSVCDPQKLIRATIDGACEDSGSDSDSTLFDTVDGMVAAPDAARLEAYNGCRTADEIDGVNPVWIDPEDLVASEGEGSRSLIGASFVLGDGDQVLPFAVVDKGTGAIFSSRAQPPIALLTNADVAILEANIQAFVEKAGNLSDLVTILVQRYTLATRGYEIPDSETVANLLVDMITELSAMQSQMGDIVRYAKAVADTPRICVVDGRDKKSKKRKKVKSVSDHDLKEVSSKSFRSK